jgi:hypothetical protein
MIALVMMMKSVMAFKKAPNNTDVHHHITDVPTHIKKEIFASLFCQTIEIAV